MSQFKRDCKLFIYLFILNMPVFQQAIIKAPCQLYEELKLLKLFSKPIIKEEGQTKDT